MTTLLEKPVSYENLPKDPAQRMIGIVKRLTTQDLKVSIVEVFKRKAADSQELKAHLKVMDALMGELETRISSPEFIAFLDSIE